jgi:hypothetical protein
MSLRLLPLQLLLALTGAVACSADGNHPDATAAALPDAPAPEDTQPRGFYVINADRASSSVSLLDVSGEVPSPPFIRSGNADAPLSLDLVAPSSALVGDELVLIDRSVSTLTWVSLETMLVRARLKVDARYRTRPLDYVALSRDKAYVPRYETNGIPAANGLDWGGDVLIIDPSMPRVLGQIDLAPLVEGEDPSYVPRPARALAIGARVLLLVDLSSPSLGFVDTRLVVIDPRTDSIQQVMVLAGMTACANLALSPSGDELAIACEGAYGRIPERGFFNAGIVIVDLGDELVEKQRFASTALGDEQISMLAYASTSSLLFTTYGRYSADASALLAPDTLRRLDLQRGAIDEEPLVATRASAFSLGDVRCAPRAGRCLLADAEREGGVLRRFEVASDGSVSELGQVVPNPELGLPPRYLGVY